MQLINTKNELKDTLSVILSQSKTLGLVPTMGALHKGHLSLIEKAFNENDSLVVSIFVNPTQFNNKEDLEKYPKTLENDLSLITSVSDEIIVYTPSVEEIYAANVKAEVYNFEGLDRVMEGEFRDNHFNGVGTIVEELLTSIKPTKAYFGEKDFQQLQIIRKLVAIKNIPVEIIGCPIVREANDLAMSSRNERLPKELREKASFIYQTLLEAKNKFGTKSALDVIKWVENEFENNQNFKLEYFQISDSEDLKPVISKIKNKKYRAFIAVFADEIRLIDNIAL
ncbi:pantoate--beta-alanine ligase [Cellulophaga sp. HaHaR_3_176]|uniref:pantoate--beta-alanine ligase n=1 Tax=Cellulophaga sp. HaHaR_3_176 TaxID=1942464 RepID=UPI001C1F823A|nr:pantoate--beta-alanine ligase [Cellulophaga sp. HaHaR_3_176]QWX83345.1 pantoate--beta-alanine ligase [Cellulophaga sp. HaHaR_3_176]